MDYKSQISDFIDGHRDDMIELLERLVRIPSVLGEERDGMPFGAEIDKVLRSVLKEAEKLGLNGECYQNMADIFRLNDKDDKLAMLCHLDVVPATDDGWTNPPFEPTIRDGMIYGRGVSDNKGPCVATLYALYAIKELGIELDSNVMLYLGGCEENGCRDMGYYLKENKMPEYVFTADACFPVGNAERGRIVIKCNDDFKSDKIVSISGGKGVNIVPDYAEAVLRGVDVYEVETLIHKADNVKFIISSEGTLTTVKAYGKSTHAAHPSDGINAISALLSVVSEFDESLKELSGYYPHGVFNGSGLGLSGGLDISITQLAIGDGKLFFTSDGRVDLDVSSHELAKIIKDTVKLPIEMTVKEPHYTDENADIVKKLNKVYEEHTGNEGCTYTLDAMTYAHGIENAVIFGGVIWGDNSANAHAIDERYNLTSLVESAKMYAAAIIEICGGNKNE